MGIFVIVAITGIGIAAKPSPVTPDDADPFAAIWAAIDDLKTQINAIPEGPQGPPGADGADGADGISCWDLNGDGTCNLDTEDVNDDDACTAADCQGPAGPKGDTGETGSAGATVHFGEWSAPNAYVVGTQYTAATDGYVVVQCSEGATATESILVWGSTPSAVPRLKIRIFPTEQQSFTLPVRAGDTWDIYLTGTLHDIEQTRCDLYWLPLSA